MEQLKSLIPNDLSRMISESTAETLARSCSSLLEFLLPLPQFRRIIGDLTDPELALCRKCKEKALDFKKIGNECFSRGDYAKALSFYSQALRCSPTTNDDVDESFVATLYVNRASSMHKMALLEECIRDCNRAIVLSPAYAKAWFRRGKANASLKNYEAAICDLEISLSMEGSLSGKMQIKEELNAMSVHIKGLIGKNLSRNNGKQNKVADLDNLMVPKKRKVASAVSLPREKRLMTSSSLAGRCFATILGSPSSASLQLAGSHTAPF